MSRDASVELPFGDDVYTFRLAWGELIKLQEARDCGPYMVLDRLVSGRWYAEDIYEVIRLGLIGGGMDQIKARKLADEHVKGNVPLMHLVQAQRALGAAVVGTLEEEVGKKPEAASQETGNHPSPTESSDLPPSTEPAQP